MREKYTNEREILERNRPLRKKYERNRPRTQIMSEKQAKKERTNERINKVKYQRTD